MATKKSLYNDTELKNLSVQIRDCKSSIQSLTTKISDANKAPIIIKSLTNKRKEIEAKYAKNKAMNLLKMNLTYESIKEQISFWQKKVTSGIIELEKKLSEIQINLNLLNQQYQIRLKIISKNKQPKEKKTIIPKKKKSSNKSSLGRVAPTSVFGSTSKSLWGVRKR